MEKPPTWGLLTLLYILIMLMPFYFNNNQITETPQALAAALPELKAADMPLRSFQQTAETKSVQMPFSGFIQNVGQLDNEQIHYYYTTPEMSIGFGPSNITFRYAASLEDSSECFSLLFRDAQLVNPVGQKKNAHYVNYFSAERCQTHIPTWDEIWYEDLYPGVDLRYYMTDQGLKYDFIVRTDADFSQITSQVNQNMHLCVEDQYTLIKAQGHHNQFQLQNTALKVWQPDGLSPTPRFLLKNPSFNRGFDLDSYNSSHTLIYSTFLGGAANDYASRIMVDASGAAYIVGYTDSPDFPITPNAYNAIINGPLTAFISKLSSDGSTLEYSTFLGSGGVNLAFGIGGDASGAAYVVGYTDSPDFPITPNAYDTSYNGGGDVFVSKLSSDGSTLEYSTFLGGASNDRAFGIVVNASGAAYVAGETGSSNFPTTPNVYATSYKGSRDAFVSKLSPDGSTLGYSTFLGGVNGDYAFGIVVDASGAAYVAGRTDSPDFPTTSNAYDTTLKGDSAFISKLSPDGSTLGYSTFLGGRDLTYATEIAVDALGTAYVVGRTFSFYDFPTTPNAYDTTHNGLFDVFFSKLSSNGSTLEYSTFLGGAANDYASGIAVDASGAVYIAGYTESSDFPTTPNAYDNIRTGIDVFVCRLFSFPSLIFPNGGEVLNGTILIQWTAVIDPLGRPITYNLSYSPDNGTSWLELASNITDTDYVWDTSTLAKGESYLLKVVAMTDGNRTVADISDSPFSILHSPPTLLFPNGGEIVSGTVFVEWTFTNFSLEQAVTYAVSYSADGGTVWNVIALDLINTTYAWDTTLVPDGFYLLKVVARFADGTLKSDISDDVFAIVNINATVTPTGTNTGSGSGSTLTIPGWTWLSVLPVAVVVFLWKRSRHRKRV